MYRYETKEKGKWRDLAFWLPLAAGAISFNPAPVFYPMKQLSRTNVPEDPLTKILANSHFCKKGETCYS